jgi:hypothetical protein
MTEIEIAILEHNAWKAMRPCAVTCQGWKPNPTNSGVVFVGSSRHAMHATSWSGPTR